MGFRSGQTQLEELITWRLRTPGRIQGGAALSGMTSPLPQPFGLDGLTTYDLESRPSKVFREDLGQPLPPGATVDQWLDSLPRQLAGQSLRRVRFHLARAHAEGRTVVAALERSTPSSRRAVART